jgi:glycerol kinase
MRVDGGAAANDLLMELQANLSNLVVERPAELESTARGAAMLAGLGVGLFANANATAGMSKAASIFRPTLDAISRGKLRAAWTDAVRRARTSS